MRIPRSAGILALAALIGAAKEPPMPPPPPSETIAGLVALVPPEGWSRTAYANAGGADLVVAFEHGADRLVIRVFGAKGSFHKAPADFFSGAGATTMGRAPEMKGEALVAGRRRALYRRRFPLMEGGPHDSSPKKPMMGTESFCVLPPAKDGRFVVISLQRESPIPDLERTGEKAWETFLRGVKLVAKRKNIGRKS